ncbi:MAG: hypothetical protein NVSMB25_15650 [Thermoleophilaceae bacterium]
MSELTREIEIDAPPERVYAKLTDPRCLAEWVTIQEALEDAPDGDLERGSRVVQRLKVAGQRFRVSWTVKEARRPTRVVWEGKGPLGSRARAVYEVTAREGGCTFSYLNEYNLPGGPAGALAGRAIKGVSTREADRSLKRLKKLVEEN